MSDRFFEVEKLSILVPGIRVDRWEVLVKSIENSYSGAWEIIFVGPYDLPKALQGKDHIRYIKDWGSPIRCQQIALTQATGDYITWAADDGKFCPEALDIGIKKLVMAGLDPNVLVMGKYTEGENFSKTMLDNEYYILSNHDATKSKYYPEGYFMLNVGIVNKGLLWEIGGWDCRFEVCPMAYNDLAIRLQRRGVSFLIQDEIMFKCSHMPGHEGDHGPIHDGQIEHDQPLFSLMYSNPKDSDRVAIDLHNWKDSPVRWWRRFGYEG